MSESAAPAEALAYADNCLDPDRRAALEAQLRVDGQLRWRVERWRVHNEAIRAAFGGPERSRPGLSLGRPSNENKGLRSAATTSLGQAASEGRLATPAFGRAGAAHASAKTRRPASRRLSALARTSLILALSASVWAASGAGGPVDRRHAALREARAAFRAFGAVDAQRLDSLAGEPATGLGPAGQGPARGRLYRLLSVDGWKPLGARLLPGLQRPATLVLFGNARHERAAVWIEPTDAAPDAPALREGPDGASAMAFVSDGWAVATVGEASFGEAAQISLDAPP